MGQLLEFREHRLAEQSAPKVIDLSVDQVGPHRTIRGLCEKVLGEEDLVEGRGHLGEEDWVVIVLKTLGAPGIPSVHRMARFMSQGVDVGKDIRLVVHENVGRGLVGSVREGTAALPFVLVPVAPSLLAQTFAENLRVFRAKWAQGGKYHFGRLIEGDIALHR